MTYDLSGFEVFESPTRAPSDQPLVLVRVTGLTLNELAYASLGRPVRVAALVNHARRLIALRPAQPGDPLTWAVSRASSHAFSARPLITACGLRPGHRAATFQDGALIWSMDLAEGES